MKIKTIEIKNFKAFGSNKVTIDLSDNIVTLIGSNNCGKTSVLEALNYFFSGVKTIPQEFFHNNLFDQNNAIEISIVFNTLTTDDKAHQAVLPYISNEGQSEEEWVLKKQYYYESGKGKAIYTAIKDGSENINPSGLTPNVDDIFTDEKMQKIYLTAVKDVADVIDPKKKSPLTQVFQMLLSAELEGTDQHRDLMLALQNYAAMFDPLSKHAKVKEIEDLISEKIRRIIPVSGVIDAQMLDDTSILPTPILQIIDTASVVTKPEFQGHGVQRSIIFALLELYAETISSPTKTLGVTNILLIEEPEMYMHPHMQDRVADVLYSLANSGAVQVVCTTHSPKFIRMFEKQKSLVRLVKKGDESSAQQITSELFPVGSEDQKRLRAVMNFDLGARECFFADRVVLVEGETEAISIPFAAELMGVFVGPGRYEKNEVQLLLIAKVGIVFLHFKLY
ncbi:MAG: hypothetical protein RLZZ517_609 [Candidatus Parcubacteria bacterium]|jgi:predicted ATP-dependent endonuclease of OLD family